LRSPFSEGLKAEAGATRIPDSHKLTLEYVKRFGLELEDFRPVDLPDMYFVRGQRIISGSGAKPDWPVDLSADEKQLGLGGMRRKYITPVARQVEDATSSDWNMAEALKRYDAMTWAAFLRAQGASEAAAELLTMGHSSGLCDDVSAVQMLRVIAQARGRHRLFRIKGGNDRLPGVMADALAGMIQYETPVVRIAQDEKGVHATVLDHGRQVEVDGDYMICALPFSVLRRSVDVTPAFSEAKQRAIDELWYGSISKLFVQTKRRFWSDAGWSGFVRTDLPVKELWDLSQGQAGNSGILMAYTSGEVARAVALMRPEQRIEFSLDHMEKIFPTICGQFVGGTSVCWDDEEWTWGAWSWLRPGDAETLLPHIARPEGRIHFAGDHTSAWTSWMQGALESGERAAGEVLSAP